MSEENHKIDDLLRQDIQRQLERFDWDQFSAHVSNRLDPIEHRRLSPRRLWPTVAAAAIILLVVTLGGAVWQWGVRPQDHPGVLQQIMAGVVDAGPLGDSIGKTDNLVANTDPEAILLTQHTRAIRGDPLLQPHSLWDQMPVSADYQKERPQ